MNGQIWPSQEAQDFLDPPHCRDIRFYEHLDCHETVFSLISLWNLCPSSEKSSIVSRCPLLPPGLAGFMPAQLSQYDSLLFSPVLPVCPPVLVSPLLPLWPPFLPAQFCQYGPPPLAALMTASSWKAFDKQGRCPQAPQVECRPPPPLLQMLQRF